MNLFSELASSESLTVLLYLLIAGLIGFLTAYFYWRGQQSELQKQADLSEKEAAELRIRNTELLMTQEEVRKEIADTKTAMTNMESANKILSREKGQLYADMTLAKKELEDFKKNNTTTIDKPEVKEVPIDVPEISLENVMKASASLSGLTAPVVEDAKSALDQKKASGDSQKDAAAFIKNALGFPRPYIER